MMYQWPPHLRRQMWMQNPQQFGAPAPNANRRQGFGGGFGFAPPGGGGQTTGVTQNAFVNPQALFGGGMQKPGQGITPKPMPPGQPAPWTTGQPMPGPSGPNPFGGSWNPSAMGATMNKPGQGNVQVDPMRPWQTPQGTSPAPGWGRPQQQVRSLGGGGYRQNKRAF